MNTRDFTDLREDVDIILEWKKEVNRRLLFDTWDGKQIAIDKKIAKIDEDFAANQTFQCYKFGEIEKDIKYIMEHLGVKRGLTIDKKD
jgi:glucose dehydrogenase